MSLFLKVKTPQQVMEILGKLPPLEAQWVALDAACGRVLAASVQAPEPVPNFPRALMDGYAVRAQDTFGASETLPALLELGGEVAMGEPAGSTVEPGKAVAIPTGGMLPDGADAIVMVEYAYAVDGTTIEVTKAVAPGDHIIHEGDDIGLGEEIFPAGRRLRPQDTGVLAALGITSVSVHKRPRVAIISTGDEVVPASTKSLSPGKIRDINTFTLAAQIGTAGVEVGWVKLVKDDLDVLVATCKGAMEEHDVLVLSGGSSVGLRDFTLQILDSFEDAELLVHGVAIRPGKPTILARIGEKLFWGLPGQPVSALMICRSFVLPSIDRLQGRSMGDPDLVHSSRRAFLDRQLPSVHGRTDYVPVVLSKSDERLLATPIFGKSAMISVLGRADGYVVIPEHVEGLNQDTEVTVHLFV